MTKVTLIDGSVHNYKHAANIGAEGPFLVLASPAGIIALFNSMQVRDVQQPDNDTNITLKGLVTP